MLSGLAYINQQTEKYFIKTQFKISTKAARLNCNRAELPSLGKFANDIGSVLGLTDTRKSVKLLDEEDRNTIPVLSWQKSGGILINL